MEDYRKGVGCIIIDKKSSIFMFQRNDFYNSWQVPEGGIENNETPINAAKREANEEVGLKEGDYTILAKTINFYKYNFPSNRLDPNTGRDKYGFMGQEKQFFLMELKDENYLFKFDNLKEEIEFRDVKRGTAKDLLNSVPEFKKEMYRQVLEEFKLI